MKAFSIGILIAAVGILAGCDSNGEFSQPPRSIDFFSLETPASGDTLEVGKAFTIKAEFDRDVDYVEIRVLRGDAVLLNDRVDNPQGLRPFVVESQGLIELENDVESSQAVFLRFFLGREDEFVEVTRYLR